MSTRSPSGAGPEVLHLIASTRRRGAEVFAIQLAEVLAPLGLPGAVFALSGGGSIPAEVGAGRFHPRTLRSLRRHAQGASVVIAHGSSTLLAAYLATIGTGVPFIYRNIGDPDHWVDTRARSWRVGVLLRRAHAVVALWPSARSTLIDRHRLDSSRVSVAGNGVPAARFPHVTLEQRRTARHRLDLGASGPTIAWIGSLSAEKDPETALRAVALVQGAHLLAAGEGPLRAELEQLAAALLPGRATFLSEVTDVRDVLAAADVVLLTSRTEGLPAVLMEAGLSGVPAVATDVGGVSQIVRDGETGFLGQVGDATGLARAVERAAGAGPVMGTRAREHCLRHFTMDATADRWEQIVRSVTGSDRS